ncbi:MAG TPA: methyltransferase domain-containing protein, partial [Planctomycetaceae bacterium]|nr:methyltransferase domain-containing protein [Planctomycetaceae bacterium]
MRRGGNGRGAAGWFILAVCCSSLLVAAERPRGADDAARKQARDILTATGVSGGFVVHLGCGDGKLTVALCASDAFLVQGLDRDPANVQKARRFIQSCGRLGRVSAAWLPGSRLPYVDNLVNLLVAEQLGPVSLDEVVRVLAPNGVAYVKRGGVWRKMIKPRPADIDEWTHFLHDATNNAVSDDAVVGPPHQLQWVAGPR